MFPHPDDSRWWLSGQVNLISQLHGQFTSPYQGDNSLRPEPEQALSRLWTIYTGVTLPGHTELLFDVESAGGRGLSDALGLAGFTNLDVVRNPTLGTAPYIARALVHVTIPLSAEVADATPTALSLAAHVPAAPHRDPRRQAWHGRFLRRQHGRQRQPPSVHQLDSRQQRCVRLRRRHSRLHVRRHRRIRHAGLVPALWRSADADCRQRHRHGLEHRPRARGQPRTRTASRRRISR